MKKLTGSEKQVAWAEDIRERYIQKVEILKEVVEIYSDITQKQVVCHDPLFGDSIDTEYVRQVTNDHSAAISMTMRWSIDYDPTKPFIRWIRERSKELKAAGEEHYERKAHAEYHAATLANLKRALEEETDAMYWIDRR